MEAPDKIYMTPSYGEPDNVLLASFSKSHLDYHRDIEYIRKDALLEWANYYLKEPPASLLDEGVDMAMRLLIEKIESL